MKAIISEDGLVAVVTSEAQRFIISAGPMEDGGYSVGLDAVRLTTVVTIAKARAKVREIVNFYTDNILEVK